VRAPADGDSAIVELAAALHGDVTVVTADRGLRARLSVPSVGPGTLLDRLP
jgi:rRNA-processing protein FCF1